MALHAWRRPSDPTVYGVVEIDAQAAQAHVAKLRAESGEHVTLTHLVGKAAALAIAEQPEVNAIVRRGRIYVRDSVDVFFQVAFEGGQNLAGAKVDRADRKSIVEIAAELARRVERIRDEKDDATQESARRLSELPPPLLRLAMWLGEMLTYDLDLDLSRWGVPYDAFGSCMITNVGGFGLTLGYAPLFPPGRVPFVLTIGAVHDAPAVVDGRMAIRPMVNIGASFDHRLLDGYHAGKLASRFREFLLNPERLG